MSNRSPIFYGWVIVVISVVTTALVYGMRHSFSIFFPYILDEFGWSRGSTSVMLSLSIFMYGFLSPLGGALGDRWRPRKVIVIGIMILGLATAGCAFAQKPWHFYLLFGILMPAGMALSGWPLMGPALANWFILKRGLVTGLGQMGTGFSFAYVMFVEFVISRVGWRHAYLVLAVILAGFLLPLILIFFYPRPEDKGLAADGSLQIPYSKDQKTSSGPTALAERDKFTLRQAMKTYQLWCLVASFFLFWGIGHYQILAHQIKFAADVGYSTMFAASIFGLMGIFSILGFCSGFISDWLGREIPITIAAILSIIALFALLSIRDTSQPWLLYVYAVCFGYAGGIYSPTAFAGAADLFHGSHYGAISSLLLTGMGLGGALGPWLGGYIYDVTGSYHGSFLLCMLSYVLCILLFWIAGPRHAARFRARMKPV
ncbi:MAG: MFS transporter [Pseudomonadota bacterium]